MVPNLWILLSNVLRSFAYLYRRLRRDERAVGEAPRLILLAVEHAVFSQVGAYLGIKNRQLSRIGPRVSAELDRFLSKGI